VAWTGTTWFIEGDISGCFDRLDRQVMLDALGESIHDNRMLRLVSNMLNAGYLEDWIWNPTLSGVPQGGAASPILSNIYLDRLDAFVEKALLPEYNRGVRRMHNPAYQRCNVNSPKLDSVAIPHRCGHCDKSCAACQPRIHAILATAGCVTCVMPMTPYSVSPDQRRKPRRSSAV
jgi:Reverse transcriptase (RNA-dependent DNA polymerase)